jgi:tRNA(Ile)-lysidine synthase
MVSYLDPERLAGPVVLRPWRAGERFEPLHFVGTRLVSDELTDAKFPSHLRKLARVLADDLGPVWIETGRIAQRVALTATTRQVLALERVEPEPQAG